LGVAFAVAIRPEPSMTDPKLPDRWSISLLMIEKLPVGVDQPGFPDAIGEIKLTVPPSIRYALCSERLIITLVSDRIADAFIAPIMIGRGGTATTPLW